MRDVSEYVPTLLAVMLALIGGAGGFAALMKVNSDNSKVVSEGAASVVKMLREHVDDLDARLSALENYADAMEVWSDKISDLLERTIDRIPEARRDPFRRESTGLVSMRPRRNRHPSTSTDK